VAEEPAVTEPAEIDAALELVQALPGIVSVKRELGALVATAELGTVYQLLQHLRDSTEFAFAQVMDICGVDWPGRPARFEVVYNLLSVTRNERLRVVLPVADGVAVPSVSSLWLNATWWEREIWDLFGIPFDGLQDHRRILTDYGFEGHPLRKDFPLTGYLEVRYDEDRKAVIYEPVKLSQEFRNFDFLSPWEAMTTLPGDEKAHRG
jgi:NADH-quinone oxidoreductase subunit C